MKDKVTVVTVSYNADKVIEPTIKSVVNQTYPNLEYVIIDGSSTDNTLNIIKKYSNKISAWYSEPDRGIYDGMNKGLDVATGDWIIFMNAGDRFLHKNRHKAQRKAKFYINKCRSASCMQGGLKQASA